MFLLGSDLCELWQKVIHRRVIAQCCRDKCLKQVTSYVS